MKNRFAIVSLTVFAALTSLAQAEIVHWSGAVDSNWNNPANWVEHVPSATDYAIITPNGSPLIQGNQQVGTLEIKPGASMVILGDLRVNSEIFLGGSLSIAGQGSRLTHYGDVFVQNGTITMWDGAMIQRASGSTGTFYLTFGSTIRIPSYDTVGVTIGTDIEMINAILLHESTHTLSIGPSSAADSQDTSIVIWANSRMIFEHGGDVIKTPIASAPRPILINEGTIVARGALTDVVDISSDVTFANPGEIDVDYADVYVHRSIDVDASSTLFQGKWICSNNGRLFLTSTSPIRSIGLGVLVWLRGPGSAILPIDQLAENFGYLTIDGASVTLNPSTGIFHNYSSLTLGIGSTLSTSGAFNNENNSLFVCVVAGTQNDQHGKVVANSALVRGHLGVVVDVSYSPSFPDKITLVQTPQNPFGHFDDILTQYTTVPFAALYDEEGASVLAGSCNADFNHDGSVDFFDYLDFVGAFSINSNSADFNYDFTIDFFDYLDFIAAFSGGC